MMGTRDKSTSELSLLSRHGLVDELRVRMVDELRDSFLEDDLLISDSGECCDLDGELAGDLLMTSRAWADVDSSFVDTFNRGDRILSEAERDGVFCIGIRVGSCGVGGPSIVFVTVSRGLLQEDWEGLLERFLVLGARCGVNDFIGDCLPLLENGTLSGDAGELLGSFLCVDEVNIFLSTALTLLGVLFSASGT